MHLFLSQIDLQIGRGKDFTGDIVELNSRTDPSSFIGFNGIDYELWKYGWNPFITESQVGVLSLLLHVLNILYDHFWKINGLFKTVSLENVNNY